MEQHEREMMVGALLDITLEQFNTGLDLYGESLVDTDLDQPLANLIDCLQRSAEGEVGADKLYIQYIALLSDDSLTKIVNLFGTSPFENQDE